MLNNFVNYVYQPATPGVYQRTPGSAFVAPDTPQARYLRTFGGIGDVTKFRAPPPPSVNSTGYEAILNYVKSQGERNSTVRKPFDTETAFFWRESSPIQWNRFAHQVIGNRYAKDVLSSAKFYAQLNYAHANAAIAGWDSKGYYNTWRPVTAVRRTDIWLPSKRNVSNPTWTPLLDPTPNHQEYISTHATFGGAAAAVIRAWNGGKDEINITQSTNATGSPALGVLSRSYTSIKRAVKENGDSRVFGGVSSPECPLKDATNDTRFIFSLRVMSVARLATQLGERLWRLLTRIGTSSRHTKESKRHHAETAKNNGPCETADSQANRKSW